MSQAEIERSIADLSIPFGDEASLRLREQAARYLLDHAAAAHPQVLALLQAGESTNPFALIDLLPRFGWAEGIAVLAQILQAGQERLSQAAALALAQYEAPAAQTALEEALTSPHLFTVMAAADGLLTRGDPSACKALRRRQTHSDPLARYHLIQAAAGLRCLSKRTVATIARRDGDENVRGLAQRLLRQMPI